MTEPIVSSPFERLKGTVGLWTFAHEFVEPQASGAFAKTIQDLGYSALWFPELVGREAFTSAALLLAGTSSLVVGTGIASIYGRDALATAAAGRTLAAMSSNRFIAGLGVSHRPTVEGSRGHTYDPPLAAMAKYLDARGAAKSFSVEANVKLPVVLAALGPKMLTLAREKTDGALPYLVTESHTASARELLGPEAFLAVEQAVVLSEDPEEITRLSREHLEIYTGLENYRNSWRRLGFTDADFVRGGSEQLQRALVTSGGIEEISAKVNAHFAAGADHVCLQVLGTGQAGFAPMEQWEALSVLTKAKP
ncbi:MAG: TIGR03620 family F420-dependent LLM class oxidoreductase [Actinomycetota bacterium]